MNKTESKSLQSPEETKRQQKLGKNYVRWRYLQVVISFLMFIAGVLSISIYMVYTATHDDPVQNYQQINTFDNIDNDKKLYQKLPKNILLVNDKVVEQYNEKPYQDNLMDPVKFMSVINQKGIKIAKDNSVQSRVNKYIQTSQQNIFLVPINSGAGQSIIKNIGKQSNLTALTRYRTKYNTWGYQVNKGIKVKKISRANLINSDKIRGNLSKIIFRYFLSFLFVNILLFSISLLTHSVFEKRLGLKLNSSGYYNEKDKQSSRRKYCYIVVQLICIILMYISYM